MYFKLNGISIFNIQIIFKNINLMFNRFDSSDANRYNLESIESICYKFEHYLHFKCKILIKNRIFRL